MFKAIIVEDEGIIRKLLVCSIDWLSMGFTVVGQSGSGPEGLELINRFRPDLVVTDIYMPGLNGIEMIEQGRRFCSFQSIIITGYSEFEYAHKAVSLGVVDYILKPIDEEKLCAAVRLAYKRLMEQQELRAYRQSKLTLPQDYDIGKQIVDCKDYYVKRSLEYIQTHYAEHISVEQLAGDLGISPGYLSRRLRRETSMSFVELLQRFRIQKAIALMSDGGHKKIYAVAEDVGYPNYKWFCKVFKSVTGCTPTEFSEYSEQMTRRN